MVPIWYKLKAVSSFVVLCDYTTLCLVWLYNALVFNLIALLPYDLWGIYIHCYLITLHILNIGFRGLMYCLSYISLYDAHYHIITIYQYSRTRRWRKFQKGKIYNAEEHVAIESFVTTLIHWTFFSDDANKVGICWLCRSGQLHVTPSSRWSLPRCHRSVRNDMRLFLRTKQYPVQLRTTKYYSRRYYSSTTKY